MERETSTAVTTENGGDVSLVEKTSENTMGKTGVTFIKEQGHIQCPSDA